MLQGFVDPNFASVVGVLRRQLTPERHGGASLCVYHRGRKVVDVWGGQRDEAGRPWRQETIAPCFSTTKGVVSTLLHMLVDDGLARYEDPVAQHWPEFAAQGKERITIKHLLCHESGLYRIGEMIEHPSEMLDWDHMLQSVAAARPVHAPGEAHAYHALTYGWLAGGLVERLAGARLAEVLEQRLVQPLGLDGCFIGLPHAQLYRRATLMQGVVAAPKSKSPWQQSVGRWVRGGLAQVGVNLNEFRAALMPFKEAFDWNSVECVSAPIPAANGQFTARSLARLYAAIGAGGELDGVRLFSPQTFSQLKVVQSRRRDRVLVLPMHWRLGFHRAFVVGIRAPDAFGHYGYGGSGAFCDPSRQVAMALVVNSGSGTPTGDARIGTLARSALRAAQAME